MSRFSENLHTLIGRVRDVRPGLAQEEYRVLINDSIRDVIGRRVYWTDLRKLGILSVPNATITGTISTVTGSNQVTGVATTWPISDVVNTTLAAPTQQLGFDEIVLTSYAGVTDDSVLLIDAGTPSQEFVAVHRIPGSGYSGQFAFTHAAGATVTQSSLVQQQFRVGFNYPIFTVMAVIDAQTLLLDLPWGGLPVTAVAYRIMGMYFTLFPNVRQIIAVVDQQQGIPLDFGKTQQELNVQDPQRTDNSDPVALVSNRPNANGNMTWELWPCPLSGRQISVLATLQWPEMTSPDDIPPPFLEPTMFTDYASFNALRRKKSRDDIFFDPKLAQDFERTYKEKLENAIGGDEAIALQDYQRQLSMMVPGMSSQFWLQHDPFQLDWYF